MIAIPEQAASLHMQTVIVWQNGLTMVFSDTGQQMPDYQDAVETGILRRIENVFRGRIAQGIWNVGVWYLDNGEPYEW
jgi:hypothetical protein